MTKAELIAAIADKAGLNKTQAKDALEAFIDSVTDSLKHGSASWDSKIADLFGVWLNPVMGMVDDPADREPTRAGLYADVERWMLFALTQRFGLWFNLCALATCLVLVIFTDLAFSWSTTGLVGSQFAGRDRTEDAPVHR